ATSFLLVAMHSAIVLPVAQKACWVGLAAVSPFRPLLLFYLAGLVAVLFYRLSFRPYSLYPVCLYFRLFYPAYPGPFYPCCLFCPGFYFYPFAVAASVFATHK